MKPLHTSCHTSLRKFPNGRRWARVDNLAVKVKMTQRRKEEKMSMNVTEEKKIGKGKAKQTMNLVKVLMGEASFALSKDDIDGPLFMVNKAIVELRTLVTDLENLR
jgi:hypothetical protein